jgi:hypothetical protein
MKAFYYYFSYWRLGVVEGEAMTFLFISFCNIFNLIMLTFARLLM